MFLTLSNGRKFVIHFNYKSILKQKMEKDQWGRCVNTFWDEHDTKTTIREWFDVKPGSRITFEGYAHCSYKDRYNKKYGRDLSVVKALLEMNWQNQLNKTEFWEFVIGAGIDKTFAARTVLSVRGLCNLNKELDEE